MFWFWYWFWYEIQGPMHIRIGRTLFPEICRLKYSDMFVDRNIKKYDLTVQSNMHENKQEKFLKYSQEFYYPKFVFSSISQSSSIPVQNK